MKPIFVTVFCLAFTASVQAGIGFNPQKDPRHWIYQTNPENGLVSEYVRAGDSVKDWKEMVSLEFAPTDVPLQSYFKSWKHGLLKTDSRIDFKEETLGDGSVIVTYTSLSANETCIRRFIKDEGGFFILAYHVHPKFENAGILKMWDGIIRSATSIPNVKRDLIA